MTLALTEFPTADSPLHRLDPRWKLAGLTVAIAATLELTRLPTAILAGVEAATLILLCRLPWRWVITRLAPVGLVVAPFLVMLALCGKGPYWTVGPVHFSLPGLMSALLLSLKALTITTLVLVLLASAPVPETLAAAQALRLPSLLVQLLLLSLRYVFVLGEEFGRLRTALRVRGYRNRCCAHSYRTIGHVTGTLLVRGAERAERVSQAMRSRAFDGHFRVLTAFRTRPVDVAACLFLSCVAIALVLVDRL